MHSVCSVNLVHFTNGFQLNWSYPLLQVLVRNILGSDFSRLYNMYIYIYKCIFTFRLFGCKIQYFILRGEHKTLLWDFVRCPRSKQLFGNFLHFVREVNRTRKSMTFSFFIHTAPHEGNRTKFPNLTWF